MQVPYLMSESLGQLAEDSVVKSERIAAAQNHFVDGRVLSQVIKRFFKAFDSSLGRGV
jgi:hypothetical protein